MTPFSMSIPWENIADCLRDEIAGYGGLLSLFEQQQGRLLARDADGVLRLSHEIEAQLRAGLEARRRREQTVSAFATSHAQPASTTLRSLLPFVLAEARPLVEALIAEANVLIHRVRRLTRHNHALLARAVETQQELLRTMRPGSVTRTYAPDGRVALAAPRATTAGALCAAG